MDEAGRDPENSSGSSLETCCRAGTVSRGDGLTNPGPLSRLPSRAKAVMVTDASESVGLTNAVPIRTFGSKESRGKFRTLSPLTGREPATQKASTSPEKRIHLYPYLFITPDRLSLKSQNLIMDAGEAGR